jgi:hypothetical protein
LREKQFGFDPGTARCCSWPTLLKIWTETLTRDGCLARFSWVWLRPSISYRSEASTSEPSWTSHVTWRKPYRRTFTLECSNELSVSHVHTSLCGLRWPRLDSLLLCFSICKRHAYTLQLRPDSAASRRHVSRSHVSLSIVSRRLPEGLSR